MESAPVPANIGPYSILAKLGEGGMGVVYAAHDPRLHRNVAIKIIREALNKEPFRERFWLEARAAAGLSHPNICQVYEVGEHEGQLYLVMELLEGEALAAAPRTRGSSGGRGYAYYSRCTGGTGGASPSRLGP